MKLSVILPCFNNADTIAIQLEALTTQQWSGGWEVIVSNNGSTDESMEIVERYRDRLPNLQIVHAYTDPGPRLGVPHSYNTGIKAATGNAFVFCEADDEVAIGWLETMGQALCQHDFVAARLEYTRLNEPWRLEGVGDGWQSKALGNADYPPYLPFASGCTFGFRRSLYEAIGELDIAFPISHDVEYSWRAQRAGFQIQFVPDAIVHYRLRHRLSAMYRQAINWASGYMVVRKYYHYSIGRLDPLRELVSIVRRLPQGIWLFLQMKANLPHSRSKFADWFWHFSSNIGVLQGLLTAPPAPAQMVSHRSLSVPKVSIKPSC